MLFVDWQRIGRRISTVQKPKAPPLPAGLPALLAPLLYPGKILCAGANYYDHSAEMGIKDVRKETTRLFFFFKPPRNAA